MNIHKIYGLFLPYFRRKRFRRFEKLMRPTSETTLLDAGGYVWNWPEGLCPARITVVNPHVPPNAGSRGRVTVVVGDGCKLPFADESFDITYSNSVIEHLSTFANQRAFAAEMRRVGRAVWVQTPARWFIFEPHLLTPFIHFLPKAWQSRLIRHFTVWGLVTRPTPGQVHDFLEEVRLLNYREMRQLFPDCEVLRERFLGMTKSYIACRTPQASNRQSSIARRSSVA